MKGITKSNVSSVQCHEDECRKSGRHYKLCANPFPLWIWWKNLLLVLKHEITFFFNSKASEESNVSSLTFDISSRVSNLNLTSKVPCPLANLGRAPVIFIPTWGPTGLRCQDTMFQSESSPLSLTSWSRSATDVSVFFYKKGPFGVTVHAKATASKLNDYECIDQLTVLLDREQQSISYFY